MPKVEQNRFYQLLGEKIRFARENQAVKQETLSSHLGLSRISISNIEAGKQKIQLHTLVELSAYLKVPIQDLLPTKITSSEVNSKLEKKISNAEIADSTAAIEKVKDFIRLSTSNTKKNVP